MPEIQVIYDNDMVSRWVYAPIHFHVNGLIDWKKSFQFQTEYDRCESVNCNRLVSPDKNLHQMGCEKLEKDNKLIEVKREYKGYISANVEKIRQIKEDFFYFDVFHTPILENHAHCDLKLFLSSDRKSVKNFVREKIKDCFVDFFEP